MRSLTSWWAGRGGRRLAGLGIAFLMFALTDAVCAQVPIPLVETGQHTGVINSIAVDRAERWLVTASEDKTARVWDLNSGRLERILRLPIRRGLAGMLSAVAISPDGSLVALGGATGSAGAAHPIYLFERHSGRLLGRSGPYLDLAIQLVFSPDGRRLAATFGGGGMRILDTGNLWHELTISAACRAGSHGADFASDGRLVMGCLDGTVRLFDTQGELLGERKVGDRPSKVRFSPNGQHIAVGFERAPFVQVLSGRDLTLLAKPDHRLVTTGGLSQVAWSHDGERLYAAGTFQRDSVYPVVSWSQQGAGAPVLLDATTDTLSGLVPLASGRLAFGSYSSVWGILDAQGRREPQALQPVLDFRDSADRFSVSGDGRRVEFSGTRWHGDQWSRSLARFDLTTRTLETEVAPEPGLRLPGSDGLPVAGWEYREGTLFDGNRVPVLAFGERPHALDQADDRSGFVLGASWSLRRFDADGREVWHTFLLSSALAVNLSTNGRFVVAALGDGTLRWYDAANGAERLALFIHAEDKRWVLFTPEGFYEASAGGDALIGYWFEPERDREGQYVDSAQLSGIYFRPDLISRRLAGDEAAIAEAVAAIGDVRQVLAGGLPPTVTLLSPAEADSSGEYELKLRVDPANAGVGELKLFIDGAEVRARTVAPPGGGVVTQRLSLGPGAHVVAARAMRADGKVASNEVQARVTVQVAAPRPVLRVLAVGISKYDDASFRNGVKFATADATKLVERLRAGAQGLYRDVDTRVLVKRADTSLARIQAELDALVERSRPEDVVVIFLAGHGKAPDGKYHFIPADFVYDGDQAFNGQRTLSQDRLELALKNLGAGKRLLILDTCDSGTAAQASRDGSSEQKDAIVRLMRATGRYILAAASPQGKALEDGFNGHGVYTAALLEGMAGRAVSPQSAMIDVDALANYVADRVPELTRAKGYEQRPMKTSFGQNFPITQRVP